MSENNRANRRKVLSTIGGIGVSCVALPRVQAKTHPDLPKEAKRTFREKYGSEAEEITEILAPLYDQYKSGKLSYEEYYDTATLEFLTGGSTPKLRKDILECWQSMPRAHRPENQIIKNYTGIEVGYTYGEWVQKAPSTDSYEQTTLNAGTTAIEPQSSTQRYRWNEISMDKGTSGAGTADTKALQYAGDEYTYPGRQKEKATVGVYGSAWASVSFWRRFIPANSGTHTIQVKAANIKGNGTTGSTTFSIWAENPDGNRNTKQADSVTTTSGIDKYYYKDFSLDSGKEYKIGFELYGSTQTGGGSGTSDYYSEDRGVTPNYQQSQYPEYYFEIKTP